MIYYPLIIKMKPKKVLIVFGLMALFGVIILIIAKQFTETCPDSGMMYDSRLKGCRPKCGVELTECSPQTDAKCTHFDYATKKCALCPAGTLWTGNDCGTACAGHGGYNQKTGKCICTGPSDHYPPAQPDPDYPGWSGDSCTVSNNKCVDGSGAPGAPYALLGPSDSPWCGEAWPKSKYPTCGGKVCSGHGSLINKSDYSACECICDAGWQTTAEHPACSEAVPGDWGDDGKFVPNGWAFPPPGGFDWCAPYAGGEDCEGCGGTVGPVNSNNCGLVACSKLVDGKDPSGRLPLTCLQEQPCWCSTYYNNCNCGTDETTGDCENSPDLRGRCRVNPYVGWPLGPLNALLKCKKDGDCTQNAMGCAPNRSPACGPNGLCVCKDD